MSCHEIMKDLFFVERGYLNGNHFVYRSPEPILIETGYIRDFDQTERLIGGLGVDLFRTRLIINTHTHCDHVGGNKIIQKRSGCDIALHKIGKHSIDTRDDWATWWKYYSQEADFFDCTLASKIGIPSLWGLMNFRSFISRAMPLMGSCFITGTKKWFSLLTHSGKMTWE